MSDINTLSDLDRHHHVHGQTNLRQHQADGPAVMITGGHGVYIKTDDGRELIDGFSGLGCTSLGYNNDRLSATAKAQMNCLPSAPTFYGRSHPNVAELAARSVKLAAVPMDRVMFQCSGSEANDAMIKFLWFRNIARGQPQRRKLTLQPDSTSCAKASTAAFFPMSALMFKEDFYQDMMRNSDEAGVLGHGFTNSGHPVGAAIALETLDIYDEIDLLGHVREVSTGFLEGCKGLMDHPLVGDARGIGLFCGIQLVKDKTKRETYDPALKIGQRVQNAAHANGLYLRSISPDRISFMPPLIINQSEIDDALIILHKALDIVWGKIK